MIVTLVLKSVIEVDLETQQPSHQSASFAIWDSAGSTAYTYAASGIPLESDVATWLNDNSASLFTEAQSNGQEMPPSVEGRAILLQQQAEDKVASGCIAATLKASTLFAGFSAGKRNAINAVLDSSAMLANSFMSAPGLVL